MEKILIGSNERLDNLQAALYLDISYYSVTSTENGLVIEFKRNGALPAFINSFSEWFQKELFLRAGDAYFKDHEHEEKWKCWRMDRRFREAYLDSFYRHAIQRDWEATINEFADGYDAIEFDLGPTFGLYTSFINLRLDLISEHFSEQIHEDYILLKLPKSKQNHDSTLPF